VRGRREERAGEEGDALAAAFVRNETYTSCAGSPRLPRKRHDAALGAAPSPSRRRNCHRSGAASAPGGASAGARTRGREEDGRTGARDLDCAALALAERGDDAEGDARTVERAREEDVGVVHDDWLFLEDRERVADLCERERGVSSGEREREGKRRTAGELDPARPRLVAAGHERRPGPAAGVPVAHEGLDTLLHRRDGLELGVARAVEAREVPRDGPGARWSRLGEWLGHNRAVGEAQENDDSEQEKLKLELKSSESRKLCGRSVRPPTLPVTAAVHRSTRTGEQPTSGAGRTVLGHGTERPRSSHEARAGRRAGRRRARGASRFALDGCSRCM